MVIAIDGKPLTIPISCGLKTYASELIKHLSRLDKSNVYYVFSPKPPEDFPRNNNFHLIVNQTRLPWQLLFPMLVQRQTFDVLHLLQQHGSLLGSYDHTVSTIHDLAPSWVYPGFRKGIYYPVKAEYVRFIRSNILRKSSYFIAVSHTVREELENQHITRPIYVIYEGVNKRPRSTTVRTSVQRTGLLAFTDFSPRKNIFATIRAYGQLPGDVRQNNPLQIIMSIDYFKQEIIALSKKLHIEKNIILHNHPLRDELERIYNTVAALVYPSLYEGFGLPILEAMSGGCPVITSNFGAMREIAGDAAVLVNPRTEADITSAMLRIIQHHSVFLTLQEKGITRAKKFSWDITAKKTIKVYEEISRS